MEEIDRMGIDVGEVHIVADSSEDAGFDDEVDTEVKCCRVHDEQ